MTAALIAGYIFTALLVSLVLLRKRWPKIDTIGMITLCVLAYIGVWAIVRRVRG